MPLKPIFEKAPLTAMYSQALHAGLVRNDSVVLKNLYALTSNIQRPSALEGIFRLACIVSAKPDEEPVTACIRAQLSAQKEDGSFAVSFADSVAILRAAWALYEYEAKKPVLEHIARWCGWAAQNWSALMEDDTIWSNPADLMELLENFYRVSGKMAVLKLCERLDEQTLAWSSVLNTIAIQRPSKRTLSKEELLNGIASENGNRSGYYTSFARINSALMLADGARSATAKGWFTGSATEMNAAKNGWERLWRYHGAVCGGLTSDELLEGTSPSAPVSTAALGAWCEALCAASMNSDSIWAWEAVERMFFNAMPAAVKSEGVRTFQVVNTLTDNVIEKDCFHVEDDHSVRALDRLVRGYTAVVSAAVSACPSGMNVNMYIPGKYGVQIDDRLLMLSVNEKAAGWQIVLHCKQDVKAVLKLRVPQWSRSTEVCINGMEHDAGMDCTGGYVKVERVWHDGDVISVQMEKSVRINDGHHQGKYITYGPVVMVMPAEDSGNEWKKSFVTGAISDSKVIASLDEAQEWKCSDGQPADIPVLPAASGKALTEVALQPYADTTARIALFPGRKNG